MSWMISRALMTGYANSPSSPGQAGAFWEDASSDGEQFAQLSLTHMPQAFLPSARMMDFSRPSRFGMTFAPLTDDLGAELLTWFLEDSHAKTSASQEMAPGSQEIEAASGLKWRASLAKYDHNSRLWKTPQLSLLGGLDEFSGTWPRWGLMRDGECWELPTLARLTLESESGLLPTLLRPNGGRSVAHVTDWRGRTAYHNGKKVQVDLRAALKRMPTLTVCGNYNKKGSSKTSGDGLATALKNGGGERAGSGPLNPDWCEWYMGFPVGWTALEPLETHRFRSAPHRHGVF